MRMCGNILVCIGLLSFILTYPAPAMAQQKIVAVKAVEQRVYDISKLSDYERLGLFVDCLDSKDAFCILVRGAKGKTELLTVPASEGPDGASHAIVARGYSAKQVDGYFRATMPGEIHPPLLAVSCNPAMFYALGPKDFIRSVDEAVSAADEPEKVKPGLRDIYASARLNEGPLPTPEAPLARDERAAIDRMVEANDLGGLLRYFNRVRLLAKLEPGGFVQGAVYLGAPARYYEPSQKELSLAACGQAIEGLLKSASSVEVLEKMARSLNDRELPELLEFRVFTYHTIDVVGSGRFTYPDSPVAARVPVLSLFGAACLLALEAQGADITALAAGSGAPGVLTKWALEALQKR